MKNFIEFIGDKIIELSDQKIEPVIVFPNKRPIAFLQKYMTEKLQKPIWFPKIYTIEEFVIDITGIQIADSNYTAACLFEIYREVLQDQADSFDDFISWWNLLIADFNDIDMYLVNADQLFNYINEAKLIENWNLGEQTPSKLQQRYLSFWKYLPIFYHQIKDKLGKQHLGYRGMIYRTAAEMAGNTDFKYTSDAVIFAGFNALSSSEEQVIEYFLKTKKGFIYWEYDDYYLKDEKQEAGKFLRHFEQKWKHYDQSIFYGQNTLLNQSIEINLIGAPKTIMQAALAGNLAATILKQKEINAALVPADESQLHPLLYQLPADEIKGINISMGYSILALPLNSFYQIIFDLTNHLEKEKQDSFSANNLLNFFSHPYSTYLIGNNDNIQIITGEIKNLKQGILSSGKIHYHLSEIKQLNNEFKSLNFYWLFESLVAGINNTKATIFLLLKLNQQLFDSSNILIQSKPLLFHQIQVYNEILEKINLVFFKHDDVLIKQSKTLYSLVNQSLQSYTLPFMGNATGGVQCIGLLETRMLQFDEIIITGCNEGILPNAKASGNSFIPFDIRNQFNLPTYKDSEAVFAYHFYRLIQGAKKVHLIYNTETDEFGSGEKSRFLSQLEMELATKNKQAVIHKEIINLPKLTNFKRLAISFEHHEAIDHVIKTLYEKGLSATALISYKNCSLQFYFKYIENIKEPDALADEVGANMVGSVIHKVLEEIYTPLKATQIKAEQLQFSQSAIENMTTLAFEKMEKGINPNSGKNLLFIQTAVRIIAKFLNHEIKALKEGRKIKILHTEVNLKAQIKINNENVNLRGTIDRIDEWDNMIRIIDYKTGSVDSGKLKINLLDDVFDNPDYDKAFQLLFYALLFQKNHPGLSQEIKAGILSLRKISEGVYHINTSDELKDVMIDFEKKLVDLIAQLLDNKMPFVQTHNSDICAYCAYNSICMK
jgi:CRISPR/Cas system-associated exonuclease Cas4 (RecB family)